MIKVVELAQTCEACPAQWDGRTDDDRPIYVRYRWGSLSVRLGPVGGDLREAVQGDEIFAQRIGDRLDGAMTFDELCLHTAGKIVWPKEAS